MEPQFKKFRIASRGLLMKDQKLLFVSDEGQYWYPPGGRLEENETLPHCVCREVFEETGLTVEVGPLLYIAEYLDTNEHVHKIDFYFKTNLIQGTLSDQWNDPGGAVLYRHFFSFEEIIKNENIYPRFLAKKNWQQEILNENSNHEVYQGCMKLQGYELSEP